jgi:hypothetical protein
LNGGGCAFFRPALIDIGFAAGTCAVDEIVSRKNGTPMPSYDEVGGETSG